MSIDLIAAASTERDRLLQELRQQPLFRRLEAVESVLREYQDDSSRVHPQNGQSAGSKHRPGTQTAAVLDATEAYLIMMSRRARTPEIVQYLVRIGVVPLDDEVTVRVVSSYLSAAKDRFDNMRGPGGGYGLVEWNNHPAPLNPTSYDPDEVTFDLINLMPRGRTEPREVPAFLRSRSGEVTADSEQEPAE